MKIIKSSVLVLFCFLILSCCKKNNPPIDTKKINENIIVLAEKDYYGLVNIPCAIWLQNNTIYNPHPLQWRQINDSFKVINDSIINYEGAYYIAKNKVDTKILYVYARIGALREYDILTGKITEFLNSTENISSALYYRGDDSIIYYTYGKPLYNNPGYYLYERKTGKSSLILSYLAPISDPEEEVVNGFDIHPTENTLLIPIPAVGMDLLPHAIEYNMDSKKVNTLDIKFDSPFYHHCLWLRYNKTGNKILYCCYPARAMSDTEIGIIDLATMSKRILDVNTNALGHSVNMFPNWSPNEKHIVYGSAGIYGQVGGPGTYHLYILKDIF